MSHVRHRVSRAANRISRGRLHRHATRRKPALVARTISCPRWPQQLDGFTILHLSDFHLGELLTADQAIALVSETRTDVGAVDLLAMTGDLIDFDDFHGAERLLAHLADYPARYGAWAVTGNHDLLVDADRLERLYDGCGVHLLHNESRIISPDSLPALRVSGIEWGRTRRRLKGLVRHACHHKPALQAPDNHLAHVLLSHNPDAFRAASRISDPQVDLVLSGHTHGGQINLRLTKPEHATRLPKSSFSLTRHRYQWGVFRRGHCRLHVTSGTGSWFPVRIKCPSEIALLTMRVGR